MAKLKEEERPEESFYEPLDLNSTGVARLMLYLQEEHRNALAAHEDYFADLKMFRRAIAAKPTVKVKTFPWPGASNIVVPLIRIAGDAVKARIVNTILGPKPFWVVNATAGQYQIYAKPWESFLEWSVKNDIGIVDVVEAIADQVVYLGKCPVKIHWLEVIKKIRTYDRRNRKEIYVTKTVKDQPCITPILLENWLEPWGLEDSQDKPWNSQRVFLRLGDITERQKQGLIPNTNVERIVERCLSYLPSDMVEASEMRRLAWASTQVLTLYETHVQFDVDDDGFREEVIVLWDYDTGVPLSARYNFFFHGFRPLDMFYYLRHGESRSSGDGIANLLWQLQDAMSSFVNQRTDNITIANTKFYLGKKNSGIKKGEQIWPGKVILTDDPDEDLKVHPLGEVSPASFTHESMLRDYSERLSGISDPQLGREFDNPRVAATTTLSVLQEGNRRFDMVIRGMRETFSRVGVRVSQLYQQFGPRVNLGDILKPEDELLVREVLSMSPDEIEKSFVLGVNTSTAVTNKETQRQGLLALFNLIVQFYSQILDVAVKIMILPQVPDSIKDMIVDMAASSYRTLKEVVMSYDISNPETFLVDVAEALNTVRTGGVGSVASVQQQFQAGLNEFAGQVGAAPGTEQLSTNETPSTEIPVGGQGEPVAAQAIA